MNEKHFQLNKSICNRQKFDDHFLFDLFIVFALEIAEFIVAQKFRTSL